MLKYLATSVFRITQKIIIFFANSNFDCDISFHYYDQRTYQRRGLFLHRYGFKYQTLSQSKLKALITIFYCYSLLKILGLNKSFMHEFTSMPFIGLHFNFNHIFSTKSKLDVFELNWSSSLVRAIHLELLFRHNNNFNYWFRRFTSS